MRHSPLGTYDACDDLSLCVRAKRYRAELEVVMRHFAPQRERHPIHS